MPSTLTEWRQPPVLQDNAFTAETGGWRLAVRELCDKVDGIGQRPQLRNRRLYKPEAQASVFGETDSIQMGGSRHASDTCQRPSGDRHCPATGAEATIGDFHQLLCHFLGNDEIVQVMQQLCDKVQYVIHRALEQFPQRITETYNEHRAIVDAIVDNNGPRAADLAHEHLEQGLRRFWSR